MNRPYLRYSIAQLEEMFPGVKSDEQILKALEQELKNRQVPRAQALLKEVQEMLAASKTSTPSNSKTDLFSAKEKAQPLSAPAKRRAVPFNPRQEGGWGSNFLLDRALGNGDVSTEPSDASNERLTVKTATEQPKREMSSSDADSTALMPLDEAYKTLRCSPSTSWEEIEKSRQKLVAQSNPARVAGLTPDQRAQALSGAKRVNLAYKTILAARMQT